MGDVHRIFVPQKTPFFHSMWTNKDPWVELLALQCNELPNEFSNTTNQGNHPCNVKHVAPSDISAWAPSLPRKRKFAIPRFLLICPNGCSIRALRRVCISPETQAVHSAVQASLWPLPVITEQSSAHSGNSYIRHTARNACRYRHPLSGMPSFCPRLVFPHRWVYVLPDTGNSLALYHRQIYPYETAFPPDGVMPVAAAEL